jgi:hypothetical protein
MSRRVVPYPLQRGSRTPEEIRAAVRKVMAQRSVADWEIVKAYPLDPPLPEDKAPADRSEDDEDGSQSSS